MTHGKYASNASPAVGDINGDGGLDIVIGTANNSLLVITTDGSFADGWPQQTKVIGTSSAALADVDSDSTLEIFIGSFADPVESDFYGFRSDGDLLDGFPKKVAGDIYSSPIVAHTNGVPKVIVGSEHGVYAWYTTGENSGALVPGFPLDLGSPIESSPAIGHYIGDDGKKHVVLFISASVANVFLEIE